MRAPDYATLFNCEDAFDAALAAVLGDDTVAAFTLRTPAILTTPRFEPGFLLGAATNHRHSVGNGFTMPDVFTGTIVVRIITKRGKNPESHAPYRSKIREKLYQPQLYFREDVLPYHHFGADSILEQSSTHSIQADKNEDISEITFSCRIGIRADAWPP